MKVIIPLGSVLIVTGVFGLIGAILYGMGLSIYEILFDWEKEPHVRAFCAALLSSFWMLVIAAPLAVLIHEHEVKQRHKDTRADIQRVQQEAIDARNALAAARGTPQARGQRPTQASHAHAKQTDTAENSE